MNTITQILLDKTTRIFLRGTLPDDDGNHPSPRISGSTSQQIASPDIIDAVVSDKAPDGCNIKVVSTDEFLDEIRTFAEFGSTTVEQTIDGIPYFTNQFWTQKQRSAHSLQEFSYHGCFNPGLPAFFIDRLSKPGEIVHDPFAGRGTTAIQSALMHRQAYGSDIMPLFPSMARPRLNAIKIEDVAHALDTIDWSAGVATRDDLFGFFHPDTLAQIESLRLWLADRAPLDDNAPDPIADWIRMVALHALTGHSSGFFSGYTVPPGRTTSIPEQYRLNLRNGKTPEAKDVHGIILKKTKSLLRSGSINTALPYRLHVCAAWDTPWIADGEVDLVVTSPPFADVIDYSQSNWLRAWYAGVATDDIAFSHHKSLEEWTTMIRKTLSELMRVVKPGGYIAFEVGEIRNRRIDLAQYVWAAAEGLPCARLGVIVQKAAFTKTAHINGVQNGKKGTNTNRIIVMRRQ